MGLAIRAVAALAAALPAIGVAQGDSWGNPPGDPEVDYGELVYQNIGQLVLERNPNRPV